MCFGSKSLNIASVNIDSLEERERQFVIRYEQGHRQTSELVSKESLQVRETIERESRKMEVAIRGHVTQTSAKFEQRLQDHATQIWRERLRERLLDSLKYPSMNERANQIADAHGHTFRWLYAEQDNQSRSNDEPYSDEVQDIDDPDTSDEGSVYVGSNYDSDDENDYECWRPNIHFTDWLQSNLSDYWIMGQPGSGKSTLAKLILAEPRTKTLLEKWRRNVIVASHYFWRPGTLMQRSIKGMLCSIVHQLASAMPDALDFASTNLAELAQKDKHTDWSVQDLQHLCSGLIRHGGRPLCLFVDALDECGPEDDHERLLEILQAMRLQDVKIIAFSRNEPIFERRFRHFPRICMQDLVYTDLHTYAKDTLPQQLLNEDPWLLVLLVQKADGVFLWLVLAVKSIKRGFENGDYEDSPTKLLERMQSLPRRLHDLYKDMWVRLNDDVDIYQKDAALYFRLVIAAGDKRLNCTQMGLSTFDMMLASSETSHYTTTESTGFSESQLLRQCQKFQKSVEVRSAGLLSAFRGERGYIEQGWDHTEGEKVLDFTQKNQGFVFIHRSARDFLIDTIDGQNILRYNGMSLQDVDLCIIRASLRALEILHPILMRTSSRRSVEFYIQNQVDDYLHDLSKTGEGSYSIVEALFSRCFELCSSSILLLPVDFAGVQPARIAAFFRVAAYYPNLDRHSINMIEKRLLRHDIRSTALLAIVAIGPVESSWFNGRENLPLKLARRLLRLHEVDVNLKSPLETFRPIGKMGPPLSPTKIGPFDHIMASPFTTLLVTGLINLDWRPFKSIRNQPQMTRFLQLVCDFISRGGNLTSTVFLACLDSWCSHGVTKRIDEDPPRLLQMPTWGHFRNSWDHTSMDFNGTICVMALEATAVIQRMLAILLEVDRDRSEENGRNSKKDAVGASDRETAVSFLTQRCQEHGHRPDDRVVGLLQPHGWSTGDMPYRQVSHEDSINLINDIWKYVGASNSGLCWDNIVIRLREVVARSPFSSIGFRDYLRDLGYFDEFAAHTMLMEYDRGT